MLKKLNKIKCPKTNKKPVLKRCMKLCVNPCKVLREDK